MKYLMTWQKNLPRKTDSTASNNAPAWLTQIAAILTIQAASIARTTMPTTEFNDFQILFGTLAAIALVALIFF